MKKQRIIRLRILDQPMHRPQNISFRRLTHGILLIIRKKNHILTGITKGLVQVRRHVLNIIDTSTQLALLTKVVDADQERFSFAGTL
jgi:hypothetical protein